MTFLENIKAVPITDLAERMGFRLVRRGHYYSLKEHDSVMINVESGCFWRNSRFQQGYRGGAGSTIDFYMEFSGETDSKKAMRQIALMYGIDGDKPPRVAYSPKPAALPKQQKRQIPKEVRAGSLALPERGKRNNTVYHYLLGRGISHSVIRYFLARKMLYEDKRGNCVFVSPLLDFACIRSTNEKRFLSDCDGSDYNHCFFFKGKEQGKRLIVTESVIDTMSFMTYLQICGERYNDNFYLSLAGTNKIQSLFVHLREKPEIREVWLCFDRDEAGEKADRTAVEELKKMGVRWEIKKTPNPACNDWNDYVKTLM